MTEPGGSLRLRTLMVRGDTFRWLWVHHDEIAALKAEGYSRLWSDLAGIRRADGHADTRSSLREAWRKVDAAWAVASPELRAANVYPEAVAGIGAERLPSSPIGAAGRPRPPIFQPDKIQTEAAPAEDDEFRLTDIRGEKL